MKILFTITTLYHGGAERVVTNLANSFVHSGYEVEILLYRNSKTWYKLDQRVKITCDESYLKQNNIFSHIIWRNKYFKSNNADIIISFLDQLNIINIIASCNIHKPLIVANRDDPRYSPKKKSLRILRNILFRFADKVIVQNTRNLEYFSKHIQSKSSIIYNEVNMESFLGSALKTEKKNKIVFVGRLTEQKNPYLLLNAFNNIHKDFPNYTLHFYGDGVLREKLTKEIKILNLYEYVFLEGASKDIFNDISDAKLFVMSSNYEGMPNALLEAMCLGLPVISTKVSGATDVIKHKENGLLVDVDSVVDLTSAMNDILSDERIQKKYAENAVKIYEKLNPSIILNEWEKCIKETIDLYEY